ncbi:N-sulphoglucosamine sulphohydrolase [Eumeta japonica]|uniref:N-sulphoglucosamine sulphohydrolase n=1 Tax=Eumeta variegata TaxID=151549 RepID=A0A4C1UWA5_EUMVA|nr:N-sulphoglucosamine sulphohydrolase [Eumeta japonica]
MGAYLNKICQTPNLDELARRSVQFDQAFTSVSSCSPSRAALLTGSPAHATGMYGLHHSVHHFNAFDATDSLPARLKRLGIFTGIIGKKHVGPRAAFQFDFEQTEENNHINQVGRNITHMKLLARQFLRQANTLDKPFFLYIAFHDPHRCRNEPQFGSFCERFGTGEPGTGRIPDWVPWYYRPEEIELPYNIQDTEAARRDVAAQYTTISRLDQGVGLMLRELEAAGHANDTLILYTSDNGIPFLAGRTNLYEPGIRIPLLMYQPGVRPGISRAMTSLLDIAPTVLHWFHGTNPSLPLQPDIETNEIEPLPYSKSLLHVEHKESAPSEDEAIFASHTHHEVTMYYPMRAIRTRRYKLIHNINFGAPFPIDQDLYASPTFQDILNRTKEGRPLYWYKTLRQYYYRPQWELYDLHSDPLEMHNLHGSPKLQTIETELRERLWRWQRDTRDPWLCAPAGVVVDGHGHCGALDNDLQLD